MQAEDEELFAKAIELRESGRVSEAIGLMESLTVKRADSAALFAALGHTYSLSGDGQSAIERFQKSIEVAPKWEPASLGLFHALWKEQRLDEAIAEVSRFLKISHSEDYVAIVKELYQKWVVENGDEDPELEDLFRKISTDLN